MLNSNPSDFEVHYRQFMDSKEPLAKLQELDISTWNMLTLKDIPDESRVDYFDIPYGTEPTQLLDIHHKKGDKLRPVVIYIHGGGWVMGDKSDTKHAGPAWLTLGYTVVSMRYRFGVIGSLDPSKRNAHPAQIEDCALALKWITDNIDKYGGDPNNIAITGIASGGHLAALLVVGTKWHEKYGIDMSKVKCWIPMSGVYDFDLKENYYHEWMPGFVDALLDTKDKKDDAAPITHITGNEPPGLIIHGSDDWIVPRTNAEVFYKKLKEKGSNVEFEMIKGYGHGSPIACYAMPGQKSAELTNRFLATYLPTEENNTRMK